MLVTRFGDGYRIFWRLPRARLRTLSETRTNDTLRTAGEVVGKLALLSGTAVSILFLYAFLGDTNLGFSAATVIADSWTVFLFVFFRWKGFEKSYSLRDKSVQRQLPRLLTLHVTFLALILLFLTFTPHLRPHLPPSWFAEDARNHSWYSTGMVWIGALIWLTQVYASRSILNRRNRAK